MNVGIDARLLSTKIRGTSRYLSNIIKYLPEYDKSNKYYLFQYEELSVDNSFYTYIQIKKNRLPRQLFEHFWLNFILPRYIESLKIDLFFTPYIFVPLFKKKWKNVAVIADALTKSCSQYYTPHYKKYLDLFVPPSIKRSDKIITISDSAMEDIIKFYNVPKDKIRYLHLWTDEKYKPVIISEQIKNSLTKKYNLPEEFILFVSVLEERKNIKAIFMVSDILVSKGINIKFVLVGRPGFGYAKLATEIEKRSQNIIHLDFVEDEDLVLLYNLAKIFFFPTHYEGFGLPPLEAMKCGIPVITSNNSSLPEVVGDGGIMGDANNYEFFAESVIRLLSNKDHYAEMKQNALRQAKKFSAEKHINELVNVFNSFKIT